MTYINKKNLKLIVSVGIVVLIILVVISKQPFEFVFMGVGLLMAVNQNWLLKKANYSYGAFPISVQNITKRINMVFLLLITIGFIAQGCITLLKYIWL